MSIKKLTMVTLMLTALTMAGCGSVYKPQLAHVPLIDHRGDIRVSAAAEAPRNASLSVSAGLTDHIALQYHLGTTYLNHGLEYTHFAGGLYFPMGQSVLETYVGYGLGEGGMTKADDFDYKGSYRLPFVQVNYGWKNLTKLHIDVGGALKVGYWMPEYRISYSDPGMQRMEYYTNSWLLEPQVFFRMGWERVKFGVQVGTTLLDDSRFPQRMSYHRMSYSIGTTIYF